jgi:hypothetical protein
MALMNVNVTIYDEGSLSAHLKYYRRYTGLHLTFKRSIWSELPFDEIHTLVSAANKFQHLIKT